MNEMPSESRNIHVNSERASVELAALWARAAVYCNADHELGWKPEQVRAVATIPSSRFVLDHHRAAAKQIDRGRCDGLATGSLETLSRTPTALQVMDALTLKSHDLIVDFRTWTRLPMAQVFEPEPFGGVSAILMRPEFRPGSGAASQELAFITIRVPIPDYLRRATPTDVNNYDIIDVSREWLVARNVLEHIFSVLRLKQVYVGYSDYVSEHGEPFNADIELGFRDGTLRREPTELTAGWLFGPPSPNPSIAATPLRVSRDLFARTYASVATEVALISDSAILLSMDRLRRLLLIIESTHSKPSQGKAEDESNLEAALREQPFLDRLQRLRDEAEPAMSPFTDNFALAAELAQLRHIVSHLQVRDAGLVKTIPRTDRFGVDPFDLELQERVTVAIRVAEAIARQIIADLTTPDVFEGIRSRNTSVHELLKLRKKPGYLHNVEGRRMLARMALARWFDHEDHDPKFPDLVSEILQSDDAELAMSFVHAATLLPQTHDDLIAAILRHETSFAEFAIPAIGHHEPTLLTRLREAVPEDRTDLLRILAANQEPRS